MCNSPVTTSYSTAGKRNVYRVVHIARLMFVLIPTKLVGIKFIGSKNFQLTAWCDRPDF